MGEDAEGGLEDEVSRLLGGIDSLWQILGLRSCLPFPQCSYPGTGKLGLGALVWPFP